MQGRRKENNEATGIPLARDELLALIDRLREESDGCDAVADTERLRLVMCLLQALSHMVDDLDGRVNGRGR